MTTTTQTRVLSESEAATLLAVAQSVHPDLSAWADQPAAVALTQIQQDDPEADMLGWSTVWFLVRNAERLESAAFTSAGDFDSAGHRAAMALLGTEPDPQN
jgi:hypothetical protein